MNRGTGKPLVRRAIAPIAVTASVLLLGAVGAEAAARTSVADQLAARVPAGVQIQTTGLVLPGLITGHLAVEASLDAAGLEQLGVPSVVKIDQTIAIATTRTTRLGQVNVEAYLAPAVTDGQLGFDVVSATANGVPLPEPALRRLELPQPHRRLACLTVTAAQVQEHGLVVEVELPLRLDGSTSC